MSNRNKLFQLQFFHSFNQSSEMPQETNVTNLPNPLHFSTESYY